MYLLQAKSRLIEKVSPELMRGGLQAKSPFNAALVQMSGIWPVYQDIRFDRGGPWPYHLAGRLRRRAPRAGARYGAVEADVRRPRPVGHVVSLNGLPYSVIGRCRKKDQDSNYTGPDNERIFIPYEAARKDFPMPGQMNTDRSVSAIIAAPYPAVTEQVKQWVEREGIGGFLGLEAQGPMEVDIRDALAPQHGFDPRDPEALSMWNTAIEAVMFGKMMPRWRSSSRR